jgi:small subunit ribosomal protein S10e
MFIPHKDRIAILTHVFREGVIAGKLDFTQKVHAQINVPNIYVCKLMKSLTSKKFAKRTYSWGWAYWVLTDAGIVALREMLHLPAETVPNTHKKIEVQRVPEAFHQRSERANTRGGVRSFAQRRDNKDFTQGREQREGRDGSRPTRGGAGGRGGRGGKFSSEGRTQRAAQ